MRRIAIIITALMTMLIVAVVLSIGRAPAQSATCQGMPGLAAVADKLHVLPIDSGYMPVPDCRGRKFEVSALLLAAVFRLERVEKELKDLRDAQAVAKHAAGP